MEFALTDEQRMIADTARDFFRDAATSERTRAAMVGHGIDRALWQAFCAELGLAGLFVPEGEGGSGLGMVEFASVAEAAGTQVAALPLLGQAMAMAALLAGGSAEQRAAWLPTLIDGSVVMASAPGFVGMAEKGKLSGTARFVAYGGIADHFVVSGPNGAWLIAADAPGVSVTRFTTMDQTRPLADVTLDNAVAEPLADATAAHRAAQQIGWLCLAAEALGGAQAAIDQTVAYAKERKQFGRAIGSFQAYKHRLADRVIDIEQARSAVYWAACAIDEGSDEAQIALHSAKAFCADTFHMCAANMIQLHGGIGFTWEHDAHLFFKRARSILSMLGDSQWHREQIAALVLDQAA